MQYVKYTPLSNKHDMCQKKQKPRKQDGDYIKPRHVNATPYKRKKLKIDYDVDDSNYNY